MIDATAPAPVEEPDPGVAEAARARLSTLDRGAAALGELTDLAIWASAVRGAAPPPAFDRIRCIAVAADHGVGREPSLPLATTLLHGGGPQGLLARTVGVEVRLVNAGLDVEESPAGGKAIRRGSGRIDRTDALTPDEVLGAVSLGRQLADEEVDAGTDLLIPVAVGFDADLPATAVIAALTGTEPVWAIGFSGQLDDAEWIRRCQVVRDALRRARPVSHDPYQLLGVAGGADLAVMVGLLLQAAVRRTPVLLDGTVAAAAGLVVRELAPGAPAWWRAPQRTGASAERLALEALQLTPVVSLGLRLGEGCGALAAVPLLRTAVGVLAELTSEPPPAPEPRPKKFAGDELIADDEPVRDDDPSAGEFGYSATKLSAAPATWATEERAAEEEASEELAAEEQADDALAYDAEPAAPEDSAEPAAPEDSAEPAAPEDSAEPTGRRTGGPPATDA
jgi:nicotinate-nucleotide--dimethylbenzimidazole phosphoribosyltransferase